MTYLKVKDNMNTNFHNCTSQRMVYYIEPEEFLRKNRSLIDHARLKLLYNELSSIYELVIFRDTTCEVSFLHEIIRSFKPDATSILDVGCGVGRHAKLLSEKYGYSVTGIDISEKMVELANSQCPECKFMKMDMREIKMNNVFDVVICMWSTFNYLSTSEDVKKFFLTVHGCLKRSGMLIIDAKNHKNKGERFRIREARNEFYKVKVFEYKRIIGNLCEGIYYYVIRNLKSGEYTIALDQELHRVYALDEITKMATPLFTIAKVFGDYDHNAKYDPRKSRRIILVLRKVGD